MLTCDTCTCCRDCGACVRKECEHGCAEQIGHPRGAE